MTPLRASLETPESAPSSHPVELLAPAGNFEKLQIALHYGADAVYVGGREFSLRDQAGNFGAQQLEAAVAYTHARGAKIYVACNIFARNEDLPGLGRFLTRLAATGPDGIIVSDPGVIQLARRLAPRLPIHLSTQANTTNRLSALFWKELGVARINAARELRLEEIREMVAPGGPQIEVFVQGAMCMAYSGRCLLSSFLTGREANRGRCSHSCRWSYQVTEESRPGHSFPIEEDRRGSYIFSSRDLCMLDHLPALLESGVGALKIEGRMKGIHYLATVVGIYRQALDAYWANRDHYRPAQEWRQEIARVSRRELCTGFFFGDPSQARPPCDDPREDQARGRFLAKVLSPGPDGQVTVEVRNRILRGEVVEVISPGQAVQSDAITAIFDLEGRELKAAHPGQTVRLETQGRYAPWDLLRGKPHS